MTRNFLVIFLVAVFLSNPLPVFAQAQPSDPYRVNRAISGSLQTSMQRRGFAANDPRFGNTLARSSGAIAVTVGGTIAGVTVGAITAPAWVSVAAGIAIATVITYAVNVGLDSLIKWLFKPDGKIDQSGATNLSYDSPGFNQGEKVWRYRDFGGDDHFGSDAASMARQYREDDLKRQGIEKPSEPYCFANGPISYYCGNYSVSLDGIAPTSCGRGMQAVRNSCVSFSYTLPNAVPDKKSLDIPTAVGGIPAADLNKQLNPAIVAALANRAWQNAASQPGYDGIPYPVSDPVTANDVANWIATDPAARTPTVGDFVSPNPVSTNNPSPFGLPSSPAVPAPSPQSVSSPNAGTINPSSTNPLANLGADPVTPEPSLEQAPTAIQILDPILNLMPSLKNYSPALSSGICPRPALNLFGHTQTFEAHCIILDNNQATIRASMLLAFALLALFIVLSA